MRFGISPLSYDLIIDGVLKEKGLKGLSEFHFSDVVEGVAAAGYQHCEIQLDLFQVFPIQINQREIEKLKKIKNQYGITYSAHFPFLSIDIAGPNKFIREGSVQSLINAYNSLKQMESDIDVFVLHPSGETVKEVLEFIISPEIRFIVTELLAENSIQSIKKLIKETKINTNKIAIENVEFPFDATIKIIKKLNSKLCLDTAHLLGGLSGNFDLLDIVKDYLDLTSEVHLQDYSDKPTSEHGALGTGRNFPPEFLKLINQNNFKGPIVFELLDEEAILSIEYIKKHAPEIKVPEIKHQSFY